MNTRRIKTFLPEMASGDEMSNNHIGSLRIDRDHALHATAVVDVGGRQFALTFTARPYSEEGDAPSQITGAELAGLGEAGLRLIGSACELSQRQADDD